MRGGDRMNITKRKNESKLCSSRKKSYWINTLPMEWKEVSVVDFNKLYYVELAKAIVRDSDNNKA